MKPPLGFVGLGAMGGAMAARLVAAGFPLHVHDTDAQAMQALAAQGAVACRHVRELGDACEAVFLCLPSPEASFAVVDSLSDGARCDIIVETSTVGRPAIEHMQQLAGPRIGVLDCPVSGGRQGALEGRLSAIVAAAPALVERARPWLDAIASRVFVVGERPGLAQVCKLANNALSLTGLAIACEAVAMGVKAGLDAAAMIEVINASTGRNSATADKFPRAILPRTFETGGHMTIGPKDLGLYLQEAAAQGLDGAAVRGIAQLWNDALQRFGPDADASLIMRLIEERAGLDAEGRLLG